MTVERLGFVSDPYYVRVDRAGDHEGHRYIGYGWASEWAAARAIVEYTARYEKERK
jgi:hypothetical protein